MPRERTYPDFDPDDNRVVIRMDKEAFLKKKPEARTGQVTLGGIFHQVNFTEDGLFVVLTPVKQIEKLN